MLGIIILTAVGAALAGGVYLGRERLGVQGLGLAATYSWRICGSG